MGFFKYIYIYISCGIELAKYIGFYLRNNYQTVHNFKATRSVDRRILLSAEMFFRLQNCEILRRKIDKDIVVHRIYKLPNQMFANFFLGLII